VRIGAPICFSRSSGTDPGADPLVQGYSSLHQAGLVVHERILGDGIDQTDDYVRS
jgi:hypothetical protein